MLEFVGHLDAKLGDMDAKLDDLRSAVGAMHDDVKRIAGRPMDKLYEVMVCVVWVRAYVSLTDRCSWEHTTDTKISNSS